MMFAWLLILVVVIAAVWAIAFGRWPGRGPGRPGDGARAEDILRERYARGELDEETYRRMLDELRRS